MTILFYKVGDNFYKSYSDAKNESVNTSNEMIKLIAEYPHIDNIEDIRQIKIEDLIDKYNRKEVKFS